MTRKKVSLAYIANDSARKATFKKRKKGLLKKMSELSTLCEIQTCAIIYSPYDLEPEVWPSSIGAQSVIVRFKNMSAVEQSKKMVNQESFLRQRITKAEDHLKKQQRENREREMTQVMYRTLVGDQGLQNDLGVVDLNDLEWLIEKSEEEIDERIKLFREQTMPLSNVVTAGTSSGNVSRTDQEKYAGHEATKKTADAAMNAYTPNQHELSILELKPIDQNLGSSMNNEEMAAASQNHQWLMEMLRSNENVGFGRNEGMLPFAYNSNNSTNNLWSTFHFP